MGSCGNQVAYPSPSEQPNRNRRTHSNVEHDMPDMKEINIQVIRDFRENNGELTGPMAGAPILLLTTTGRGSGKPHTAPVGFVEADDRLVVAAANGGSHSHPDWYRNLRENSAVTIEVMGRTIAAVATVVSGSERAALLDKLSRTLPGMSDHIEATDRDIPVIAITERR